MSWIKLTSVTATNGSKIVVVNSGSTTGIKAGDALKLGAFDVYEIEGVFAAQIQLREPWGNATQNNAAAVVVPTFGDFNAAVEAMRSLTEIAVSNLTALEQWGTQTGTVNFQGQDGETHTARTLLQMDADVQESSAEAIELGMTGAMQALVAISGGKWQLLTDNYSNTQVVRRIPIHTFEDLNIEDCPFTGPLDCFIRQDGSLRPYVDIPVYLASSRSGKAVSEAGRDPWASINADTARSLCVELGDGAVMMGREIMAMLGWKMIADGFQPRGNTEYGRSHSNTNEFGRRADELVPNDRNGTGRTMTGTGPETWRHDGTSFGIADLVGNVWEWDDGWKMVNGQFYVAEYTGQAEVDWVATGVYINESGEFSSVAPSTLNSGNKAWADMTKAAGYAGDERLQRLLIEPIDCSKSLLGTFYWNLDGERFPLRGGSRVSASGAGPAALYCSFVRSNVGGLIGFRSAFVS